MKNIIRPFILVLATFILSCLVVVTWSLVRVSYWIVLHDPVWDQMDKEGAVIEHEIAEIFRAFGSVHITVIEVVFGLVFIILLRDALFSSRSRNGSD